MAKRKFSALNVILIVLIVVLCVYLLWDSGAKKPPVPAEPSPVLQVQSRGLPEYDNITICEQKIAKDLDAKIARATTPFNYSFVEARVFESFEKAERYRKENTTLSLEPPLCPNEKAVYFVAVMYKLEFAKPTESLWRPGLVQSGSRVVFCNENGEIMKRGTAC